MFLVDVLLYYSFTVSNARFYYRVTLVLNYFNANYRSMRSDVIVLGTPQTSRLVIMSHVWLVVLPLATGHRLPGLLSVEV